MNSGTDFATLCRHNYVGGTRTLLSFPFDFSPTGMKWTDGSYTSARFVTDWKGANLLQELLEGPDINLSKGVLLQHV